MVPGPGQFFAVPADRGGRLLDGDPGHIKPQDAGLGQDQPCHHPPGPDQSLRLIPGLAGSAPPGVDRDGSSGSFMASSYC